MLGLFVYQFQYCTYLQELAIEFFTKEYRAEIKEFKPVFVDKDQNRKKIFIKLQEIFHGKPQITSLRYLPENPEMYLTSIKSGELFVYDFRNRKMILIHKFNVLTSSEQGLLGIALHPDFSKNNLLYIHYSVAKQNKKIGRISEFFLEKTSNKETPFRIKNERILLEIEQPYANHNGGNLEFGPDGFLYIGLGDGGWRDDPHNESQNPATLLGSLLRIDVKPSRELPYSIPDDNPYVQNLNWRKEIFAIGLRNPWKFCFHPFNGFLIVADVGQDEFEEISIVEKGKNYGWRIKEGIQCYLDKHLCKKKDLVDPVYVYDHTEGQSITGGFVYISDKIPELKNKYIFGDFVEGKIWAIPLEKNQKVKDSDVISLGKWPVLISTFGITREGEVLVGDYQSGKIFKIVNK